MTVMTANASAASCFRGCLALPKIPVAVPVEVAA